MKVLLITGIPGTGKTKIGNHLKENYGFYHIDIERPEKNSSPEFVSFRHDNLISDLLFHELRARGKDAVITWGFYPVVNDHLILSLQELGAKMFWLDGDKELAKEWWRKGENSGPDIYFDTQIKRIDNHNIQGIFSPININTLDIQARQHRNVEEVVQEIFNYL